MPLCCAILSLSHRMVGTSTRLAPMLSHCFLATSKSYIYRIRRIRYQEHVLCLHAPLLRDLILEPSNGGHEHPAGTDAQPLLLGHIEIIYLSNSKNTIPGTRPLPSCPSAARSYP